MTILLATTSRHKRDEIAALLEGTPDLVLHTLASYPATEAPDEDGATMRDNARIKAQFYATHFGMTVLADDSGLEVDALDGAPGVHSARWIEGSDADRTRAVLEKLDGVPESERGARYRCALCLSDASGIRFETESTCEGEIALAERGENGFGYDPVFGITLATGASTEWVGRTLAEAPPEIKAEVSHRARAVRALKNWLMEACS